VHFNAIGKPNHRFAWFVIDFLAMSILFDTFSYHRSMMAPVPYNNVIKFCIDQGNSWVNEYFINKKTGKVDSKGCVNLDKLWATSTKFVVSLMPALFTPFGCTRIARPMKRMYRNCGFINFMILQLFHPSIIYPVVKLLSMQITLTLLRE